MSELDDGLEFHCGRIHVVHVLHIHHTKRESSHRGGCRSDGPSDDHHDPIGDVTLELRLSCKK